MRPIFSVTLVLGLLIAVTVNLEAQAPIIVPAGQMPIAGATCAVASQGVIYQEKNVMPIVQEKCTNGHWVQTVGAPVVVTPTPPNVGSGILSEIPAGTFATPSQLAAAIAGITLPGLGGVTYNQAQMAAPIQGIQLNGVTQPPSNGIVNLAINGAGGGTTVNTQSPVAHNYVTGFNSSTGNFSTGQPSSADISDFPTAVANNAPIKGILFNGVNQTPSGGVVSLTSPAGVTGISVNSGSLQQGNVNLTIPTSAGVSSIAVNGGGAQTGAVSLTVPVVATTNGMLKGNNAGGAIAATAGTDYVTPAQVIPGTTGLVKSTGSALVAASVSDLPTGYPYSSLTGAPTGTAVTFPNIQSGSNTTATMLCSTGCSLGPSGSGSIIATSVSNVNGLPSGYPYSNLVGTPTLGTAAALSANSLLADPGSSGLLKRTAAGTTAVATVSDLPSGYPYSSLSGAPTGGSSYSVITISHTFSAAGSFSYAHNLNSLYPLQSCYATSGAQQYTSSLVDANHISIQVAAPAVIVCAFGVTPTAVVQ